MKWKDITSYSQSDKIRKPSTWSCNLAPDLAVTITSSHIYYPGSWIMHCHAISMDTVPLKATTEEQAKEESVIRVRDKIHAWHNQFAL